MNERATQDLYRISGCSAVRAEIPADCSCYVDLKRNVSPVMPMHGYSSLPPLLFLTGLICAAGFSMVLRALGDERAYKYWALSLWAGVFSAALIIIFPSHRPLAVVVLGHAALAASQVLLIAGFFRYCRLKWSVTALIVPAVAYTAAQTALYLFGLGSFPRFALYSLAVAVWDIWSVQLLLRYLPGQAFYGSRLAVLVISVHAALHTFSLILASSDLLFGLAKSASESLPIYYIAICMSLAKAFALLAMVIEKLINDLKIAAEIDGMTGLANRSSLIDRGEELLMRCREEGVKFAVLFVDIDQFKAINDDLGHHAGDIALKAFASIVKDIFDEEDDICGRYGGEEFVCLLTGDSATNVVRKSEMLRSRLAHKPIRIGGHALTMTVSIGVATDDGEICLLRLIKRADGALYESKNSGRDRVTLAV